MSDKPLTIVQVHSTDLGGGAEQMAYMLHQQFCRLGHDAYMIVGQKHRDDVRIIELPSAQCWRGEFRVKRLLEQLLGLQYLYAPASSRIQGVIPLLPDVMLIHSLHANTGYFSIGDLVCLSRKQAIYLYLQDQWLMTGHCAYSLGCERWQTGCGKCPDLGIYPALTKDGTRLNWIRKFIALRRSKVKLGSPAKWILNLAKQSPLLSHFDQYYIPNGVDLNIFCKGDKQASRLRLGLDPKAQIVLFLAQQGSKSAFKDFDTLAAAFRHLRSTGCSAKLLTVGGLPDEATRSALPNDVDFRPYTTDRNLIADYYRAVDIFCHITKADVCPLTVLEAQACGTPVVGTSIGGVPEIIVEGVTGWTVPPGDRIALSDRISMALSDAGALDRMGTVAAEYAAMNFGIEQMAERFITMFKQGRLK